MVAPAAHTLRKAERLCGKKDISRLFSEGKWGAAGHIRYCWVTRTEAALKHGDGICGGCSATSQDTTPDSVRREDDAALNRLLVSVSKRFFKRAVKRNLLKRRTREAYRLSREALRRSVRETGVEIDVALVYSVKECQSYRSIAYAVQRILERIRTRI